MTGELRDNPCKSCNYHDEICHSVCLYYKEWREKRDLLLKEEVREKALDVTISSLRHDSVMKSLRRKSRVKDYKGRS